MIWGVGLSGCRCGERRRRASREPTRQARQDASVSGLSPVEIDAPDAAVRLPIVEEREPNNWPEFAMTIRAGTAVRGRIGYPLTPKMGDRDVYCFVVPGTERQILRVDVTGVPKLKLQLEVRTFQWGTVHTARSPGVGRDLIVSNLSLAPGRYCFVVREARGGPPYHFNRRKAYVLTYSLRAPRDREEQETNETFYSANLLRPGEEIRGLVGRAGDNDWFRVPLTGLPAGSLLSITFVGVGGVTADVTVFDYARRKILTRRGIRGATVYIRDLKVQLHTGLVYVLVTGLHRFNSDDYYRLQVNATEAAQHREVEPNDTPTQAVRLRGKRGEVRGSIEVGHDKDFYYLSVTGRANVRLELKPPAALDGRLTVFSLRGAKLADANFGKTGESELLTNIRATHGVRIRVSGADRSFDPKHSYRLLWVVTPADRGDEREPNDTQRTATLIAPGVSARGYIYPRGDVDYYRFRLPGILGSTQKVRISVQGVPKVRLQLTLLDDQNNALASRSLPTSEGLRQITTTLHSAKYYYLKICDQHGRRVNTTDNYELLLARTR